MFASDLITSSLRLIGVLGSGETPSTDEMNDGLASLQSLLASWSADELLIFATRTANVVCTIGTVSYAIPGGRPVKILAADFTIGIINSPVEVIGPDKWASIPDKNATSPQPRFVYCDYAYPTPAVLVTPIPASAGLLNLYCLVDLATVTTSGDLFNMPEGYARAIRYNLALDLAPEYGRPIDAVVAKTAVDSMADMKRLIASNRAGRSALEIPPVPAAAQ